jgi:hypothetical protein
VAVTAAVVAVVFDRVNVTEEDAVAVSRLLDQIVVESDDEHIALQHILSGDPERITRGRRMLEDAALMGRPTAQRHLATYWALTDNDDRRARVYQWLVVALACARGIDLQTHTEPQINYLLFLSNIAQIEQSTSDRDKQQGRAWAKGWFEANRQASGLDACDVTAIDGYHGD